MMHLYAFVGAALLVLCTAAHEDSMSLDDSMSQDQHYLRKRFRSAGSFNYHKCCLETGDSQCCSQSQPSLPSDVDYYEEAEPLEFLRVGLPSRHHRYGNYDYAIRQLVAAELEPLRDHWKSRRIAKKFKHF